MGFFTYVVTFVFQFLPFIGEENGLVTQQPPTLKVEGVAFDPHTPQAVDENVLPGASTGFQCHYPSLLGWELCNGPNSRGCWLRDTYSAQPIFSQFDIYTDYENYWPPGITREVYTRFCRLCAAYIDLIFVVLP
jgi:hypothetical protein